MTKPILGKISLSLPVNSVITMPTGPGRPGGPNGGNQPATQQLFATGLYEDDTTSDPAGAIVPFGPAVAVTVNVSIAKLTSIV